MRSMQVSDTAIDRHETRFSTVESNEDALQAFAHWVTSTNRNWPDKAIEAARLQFIDVLGVTVAGATEDVTRITQATVSNWGTGQSTIIGTPHRLAAPWAALVNGTAAHALDFDDNFDPAKAHASAVLVPAILALGEECRISGMDAIDAYIVGLQIMGRIGQGINPYHRNRGWHATATVGAIAAAAAGARLLQLNAAQTAHALSLATSMASGSMAQFGSMTKPLHAGLAAKSGVMAASLARAGISAGAQVFDGPYGIGRLMVGPDYEKLRDSLEHVEHGQTMRFESEMVGEPLLILSDGFRVKRFPNCGSAHRAMDGLLELLEKHELEPDEIEKVIVAAPASHLNNLPYTCPRSPLEAKFSLEFALSLIVLNRSCSLSDFSPDKVADLKMRSFYSRIVRRPVDQPEGTFPTEVQVQLRDSRSLETCVNVPHGSRTLPFTEDIYWQKFGLCLSYAGAGSAFERLRSSLTRLPQLPDIGELTSCLRISPENEDTAG
ncbi:MmgE/PrpD family protein [Parasphingorhabdus sp.]|uniref:MmgE/PrpD family protein n=1 Tax=Parasphingorhabdus sp. TaxID=2709688 RepID=UPI00359469A1